MIKTITLKANQQFYSGGHLNYCLSTMNEFKNVDDYLTWLDSEPVCNFTNSEDWTHNDKGTVYYMRGTSDEESYNITLHVQFENGDLLGHSAYGSQSMFYQILPDNKVRAIYID